MPTLGRERAVHGEGPPETPHITQRGWRGTSNARTTTGPCQPHTTFGKLCYRGNSSPGPCSFCSPQTGLSWPQPWCSSRCNELNLPPASADLLPSLILALWFLHHLWLVFCDSFPCGFKTSWSSWLRLQKEMGLHVSGFLRVP